MKDSFQYLFLKMLFIHFAHFISNILALKGEELVTEISFSAIWISRLSFYHH